MKKIVFAVMFMFAMGTVAMAAEAKKEVIKPIEGAAKLQEPKKVKKEKKAKKPKVEVKKEAAPVKK